MKDIQDIFPSHFDCIIFSSDVGQCFDLFIPWSCSSLECRGNFLQSGKGNGTGALPASLTSPLHHIPRLYKNKVNKTLIPQDSHQFHASPKLFFSFLQGTFFSLKLYGFIWDFFFFANLLPYIWSKVLREIKEVTDHLPKPFSLSSSQT